MPLSDASREYHVSPNYIVRVYHIYNRGLKYTAAYYRMNMFCSLFNLYIIKQMDNSDSPEIKLGMSHHHYNFKKIDLKKNIKIFIYFNHKQ